MNRLNEDDFFPPKSTTSSLSTIRPRNTRLISFNDGEDSAIASSCSPSISPFPSRGVSPIPGPHPSRPKSTTLEGQPTVNGSRTNKSPTFGTTLDVPISSSGLWESWSSLQGLASTLLGSNTQTPPKAGAIGTAKAPAWKKPDKPSISQGSNSEWGPNTQATSRAATGTIEERQAKVQAKKREALLLADVHEGASATAGRFKRRDSDADLTISIPQSGEDPDALVYIHHVRPDDTLAGVMIKYNCQPAVFRKVNRFWPNDNIQIRTHVFLPLESCGVRGKKLLDRSNQVDLLGVDFEEPRTTETSNSDRNPTSAIDALTPLALTLTASHDADLYKHESWVEIPSIPEPVEIIRVPRRFLGFFPLSRRKSVTSSDTGHDKYSNTTPKTSVDFKRLQFASLNSSPARGIRTRPHRSSSIISNSPALTFADRLKGPGGVGTLRGTATSTPVPGPAEDSFNKMFAHHLPNVAPRDSMDSIRSTSSGGLENVGGAIEGWVRKIGGKVTAAGSTARERMGDLIELESSEGGFGDEDNRLQLQHAVGNILDDNDDGGQTPTIATESRRRKDAEEDELRDRFPPRRRMQEAYPGKGKSD